MNHSTVLRDEEAENSTSSTSRSILMDSFLATNNFFCGVVGIPLNFLIAAYIVLTPRLHRTRNILWLGFAFSNVLVLLEHLVEFYAYQFQSETAKKFYYLAAGVPYASQALNLFFSLVDRYVSIAHSAWYKRKVTTNWIVSGQVGCFSILFVLTKGPYFVELIPIPEGPTITDLKIFGIVLLTILLLSLVGQVFVYFKIKYYLDLEKDANTSLSSHRRTQHICNAKKRQASNSTQTTEFMGGESYEENSLDDQPTAGSLQSPAVTSTPFFIYIGNEAISRLELKAARHAVDSVSLFFGFFLPSFVAVMFAISTDCSFANHLIHKECSTYLWTFSYTRGLMMLYSIINPFFFVARSPDLSRVLNRSG